MLKNKYDLLKAFAILLVVLGHVTNHYMDVLPTKAITITVYLFHMSLFVAISGVVFQLGCEHGKYAKFLPLMANKVKRLLVPFAATALLVLAPTIVFCGKTELGYWGTVLDIFKGGVFIKHLWYLQALFWIFIAAWAIKRLKVSLPLVFFVAIALSVGLSALGVDANRYLSLGLALDKLPMFILGMMLLRGGGKPVIWIMGCLLFGGVQIISHSPFIDSIVYQFFSASIVGLIMALADYAYKWLKDSRLLAFLVKNSFGIYLFHMTPIYLIRYWGCDDWPLGVAVVATFVFTLVASVAGTMAVRVCRLGILIGEK